MGKVVYLENGQKSTRLWYVWCEDGVNYQTVEVTGLSKAEAIALLPVTSDGQIPNFVAQMADTAFQAVDKVRTYKYEDLFFSPVP